MFKRSLFISTLIMPTLLMAGLSSSQAITDDVISEQRKRLAENTQGLGFGPQSMPVYCELKPGWRPTIREKYAYGYVERSRSLSSQYIEGTKKPGFAGLFLMLILQGSEFVFCAHCEYLATTIFIGIYV